LHDYTVLTVTVSLAKYIHKQLTKGYPDTPLLNHDKSWCRVPTENELAYWIQAYKTRKCVGHSEWSERYNRNIWVSDYEED
jgi:hypothetical protein